MRNKVDKKNRTRKKYFRSQEIISLWYTYFKTIKENLIWFLILDNYSIIIYIIKKEVKTCIEKGKSNIIQGFPKSKA